MKTFRFWAAIGLPFLLPALAGQPAAAQALDDAGRAAAARAAVRQDFDARITLSGEVKDENGRLLPDVEVRLLISVYDPESPSFARNEIRRERVDGYFRFVCEPCAELRVDFRRPGFHGAELTADWSEKSGAAPVVEKLNLQVTLRRAGALPRLDLFQGRLVVAESEEEQVLPLGAAGGGGPAPFSLLPKSAGSPSPPLVRLEVGRQGGMIATREIAGKAAVMAPEQPRLDFGEGGVVRAPASGNLRAQNLAMREAPAEGYSRYLELDPAGGEIVYFYCRIGGLYGRGSVSPPTVEQTSSGQRVVAHVEILINPDGSRNLERLE